MLQRSKTRDNQAENIDDNNTQSSTVNEISFVVTPSKWKEALVVLIKKLKED